MTRRLAKAIAALVFGPLLGILLGFLLGVLAMPPQAAEGGRAPGDGFLIVGCVLFGFLIALAPSVALAVVMLYSPSGKT